MTAVEVKQQLRQYLKISAECDSLSKRIKGKRNDLVYLQAVVTDSTPRNGGTSHSLESIIERIDILERRYQKRLDDCQKAKQRVQELISLAPEGYYRDILELHYIDGIKFDDIPEMLFISRATMWRYYNAAIKKIETE